MNGWVINEYGGTDALRYSDNLRAPVIRSPHEVLVEVHTTAVNPLDQLMTGVCKFLFKINKFIYIFKYYSMRFRRLWVKSAKYSSLVQ